MEKIKNQSLPAGTILRGPVYTYTIETVLGQGAFGITYLASTSVAGPLGEIEVPVAIKEFFAKELNDRHEDGSVSAPSSGSMAAKYGKSFQRESENLSRMKHKGIVKVLESFEANGTYYYSMEYYGGGTLDDKVNGRGLPEGEALEMVHKIGEALSYMHDRKMMHLDLKPKNIMIGKDGRPVIIDFGLSKQFDSNGEPESSSSIGLGTPGYAPIEQANQTSDREFQPTMDIYALGATLYKMLTGKAPLPSSLILNKGFPEKELLDKGVSSCVISAIKKAMAPVVADRPQSVRDFIALLDGVPSEETVREGPVKPPVVPQPSGSPTPSSSGDGKKPGKWLWALLAGLVVVGIFLGLVLGGKRKHKQELVPQVDTVAVVTDVTPESTPAASPAPVSEQAAFGSVKVSSTPSGATIWLDGKNTRKTTPEILEELTPGKHNVKMVLDGYEDYTGSITVTSGKRTELSKTLTSKQEPPQVQSTQTVALASEALKNASAKEEPLQEQESQIVSPVSEIMNDASVKTQLYYTSHESELLPDAQASFKLGDYDRTVNLCVWHYIMVGTLDSEALREKAEKCSALAKELVGHKEAGRDKEAEESARALVALNPDDPIAIDFLRGALRR